MRHLFIVDPVPGLNPDADTSVVFMREAARRGHRVATCGVSELSVGPGGRARSRRPRPEAWRWRTAYPLGQDPGQEVRAVGLDAGAKEGAYQRIYPEKLAVVLGSEGSGLRPMIRQECDFLVSLPMRGKVESLNVAVAGGIFLYELLRQKEQEPRIGAFGSVGREAS